MIARDSPLKREFTGSEAVMGNFTRLALTENSESQRIKRFQRQASKKGDILWTKAGSAHKWLSGICG